MSPTDAIVILNVDLSRGAGVGSAGVTAADVVSGRVSLAAGAGSGMCGGDAHAESVSSAKRPKDVVLFTEFYSQHIYFRRAQPAAQRV